MEEDGIIISKVTIVDNKKINLNEIIFLSLSVTSHSKEWLSNFTKVINKFNIYINYKVTDLFIPEEYTTWRDSQPDRVENGPLYNIPLLTSYGIMFSGLTLGVARTMLEDFKKLAETKTGGGMKTVLRENAVIQSQVAINEAKLCSSRAFLIEMIEEYWAAQCSGEPPSFDVRARLRLAITYSMNQAQEAANFVFQACGTNAIFEVNPFERRFRDIHTVLAQGQSHVSNYEPVGEVLMGLPPSGHRV